MQLTVPQRLRYSYTKGKNLSVAGLSSRSLTQGKLQLNHSKHKKLPQQVHSATMAHDNNQTGAIFS